VPPSYASAYAGCREGWLLVLPCLCLCKAFAWVGLLRLCLCRVSRRLAFTSPTPLLVQGVCMGGPYVSACAGGRVGCMIPVSCPSLCKLCAWVAFLPLCLCRVSCRLAVKFPWPWRVQGVCMGRSHVSACAGCRVGWVSVISCLCLCKVPAWVAILHFSFW